MSKKWKYGNVSCDYYHNEAGKILGKITKISFSDEIYSAEANGNDLGEYIDKAHAKAAVEKAINNPYFDLDDIISKNSFEHYSEKDTGYSGSADPYLTPMFEAQDIDFPYMEPSSEYDVNVDISSPTYTISLSEEEEKPKKKKKK